LDVLRKTNFPEEVHIVAKTPGRERPWILFDGLRWRNRKFPENVTISILTPPGPYSLDLAFGEPGIPFPDLWKRSKKAVCFGVTIRIAAKEDILTLKRLAGRPKDLLLLDRLRLTPRLKGRR
jgi:hypothetical protein